jgi:hypothetical protein
MHDEVCPYCGKAIRQRRQDGRCPACGKPEPATPSLRLSEDLRDFLAADRQLQYDASNCEAGRVTLLPLEKLRVGKYLTRPTANGQVAWLGDDPHQEEGYYSVPAVNLVADCDGYYPEGILIWLPEEGLFGTWQSDFLSISVFPGMSWSDIVADPVRFINRAMGIGEHEMMEELKPWPKHPFGPP